MIQAIGLTSPPRCRQRARVDDLSFEARPGRVTALLGPPGAGKSTALRLMLQLDPGRGVALFRGRPLHRVPHPAREVGILLGDVAGHPARSARGHLRMLAAAAGVPAERAEELLDLVGLAALAEQRLGTFSLGMDRRLGLASALLGDPHSIVLDEPAQGLSPREASWLHGLLRGYAAQGGTVLTTVRDPKEAARLADRVVTLDGGRLVADQDADDFARTRLRPRVAVSSPHAERLASLLSRQARVTPRDRTGFGNARPEVVREAGTRLSVYGSSCAEVGETAYRHGILVHRLAEETGDMGIPATAAGRGEEQDAAAPDATVPGAATPGAAAEAGPRPAGGGTFGGGSGPVSRTGAVPPTGPARGADSPSGPPRLPVAPRPGPAAPLRYEALRFLGLRANGYLMAGALLLSLLSAVFLVATGDDGRTSDPVLRQLSGWPDLPLVLLPPAAAAAGLLGAMAFGQEFRYPALAPAHVAVPRRLGLLAAKLAVSGAAALMLCALTVVVNTAAIGLLFGAEALAPGPGPTALPRQAVWFVLLTLGCAWAGLVAAGAARSTAVGLAAVLAVPLLVVPVVREWFAGSRAPSAADLTGRMESALLTAWPSGAEGWTAIAARLLSQPVGQALALSVLVLLGAYVLFASRGRVR